MNILRTLIAGASGQRHRSRKGRRHRHGIFAFHGRAHERREVAGRRAGLVKQEISLWRLGTLVCVLLVLIWVGWRIIAHTAAQSLAKSHPNAALGWVADQPTALNQLAQQELLDPDGNLDSARELAQRALRSNPLNARALTLLGLIAERKGDQKSADVLMRISGARTLSDPTADAWLFNREVRRGDYSRALPYVDAMLRMDLESQKTQLFPVLAGLTANPLAFKALTEFLATSPPWRTLFLSALSTRLPNQARLVQLYAALNETENPPTNEELRPFLNRLIKDGNFEQAYQTWQKTLPPKQRANETYPFNRDFDIPADGLAFNWNLEAIPGADIQIVSSVDGDRKRALLVQFSGARVRFANVKQLMLLPAGDYTFGGKVKTEELLTSRGLWWHIFCANNPATTLANTELVSGTMSWTDFTVKFQVPATDCRAQWLQLELPARIEPELRIEGQVWYQDLRITLTPTTEPSPRNH
jgi:tetratricopeptide (TPR) repeat protein